MSRKVKVVGLRFLFFNLTITYNWQPAMWLLSMQHLSSLLIIFGWKAIVKLVHSRTMWLMRKELPLAKVKTIWEDSWLMNINRHQSNRIRWSNGNKKYPPKKVPRQSLSDESCWGNPREKKGARAIPERRKVLGQSPSDESCSGNPRATKVARAIPERRNLLERIVGFSFEPNTNGVRQLLRLC
jgi:hypothetical protein